MLLGNRNLTSILSEPILKVTTGTWSIYLARKFFGPQGELLGTINGGMEQQYLERYFSTINLGPGSSITLFRRDGVLLASHPPKHQPEPFEAEWLKSVSEQTNQGAVGTIDADDGAARHAPLHCRLAAAAAGQGPRSTS